MSLDFGPTVGDVLFGAVPVVGTATEPSETDKLIPSDDEHEAGCTDTRALVGPLHAYWPTAAFIGTQMAWAAQIGYVTPTLRTLGLRDSEVGYAWLAGPLAGLCIQPFVGLYSDYTTHPWGRRRIYILFGGLLSIAGLIGFSNADSIGTAIGGEAGDRSGLALAIMFFWFLDFSINISQGVQRPLLADIIQEHEQSQAHAFFALNNGLGKLLGYGLGSLSLVGWAGLSYFDTQLRALFTVTAIVLAVTSGLTLAFTKERIYVPPPGEKVPTLPQACSKVWAALLNIPTPIKRAFMVQFCAYWGLYSTYIYVSNWFGEMIYAGDPEADDDSTSYALYEAGVEAANFGLLLAAGVSVVYSLFLPLLVRRWGIRLVWGLNLLLFAAILLATTSVSEGDDKWAISLLAFLGFPLAATYQIPWTIVTLTLSRPTLTKRRVGRFTTIFNMSQCLPEIFVGLFSGVLVKFTGKVVSAFVCAGIVVLVGAGLCYYVIDPLEQMDPELRSQAFRSPSAACTAPPNYSSSETRRRNFAEGDEPGGEAAGGGVEAEGQRGGAAGAAASSPEGRRRGGGPSSGATSSV